MSCYRRAADFKLLLSHNGGPALSPIRSAAAQLFASGAQGGAWDYTQLDMLSQDAAGTLAVAELGQSLGNARDLSPNANHVRQTTNAARPLYALMPNGKPGALFNGTDQFLMHPGFDLSGTDKVTIFAAIWMLTGSSTRMLTETTTNASTNIASFALYAPRTSQNFALQARGSGAAIDARSGTYTAPVAVILTAVADIAAQTVSIQVNDDAPVVTSAAMGSGTFGLQQLFIGSRAGTLLPFHGGIAAEFIVGRGCTPAETAMTKAAFAPALAAP